MRKKTKKNWPKFFWPAMFLFLFVGRNASAVWDSSSLWVFGLPDSEVETILVTLLNWLLSLVGILGVLGFVVGGIAYLTAYGDDNALKKAKNIIFYSVIGVVVALVGLMVVSALAGIFIDGNDDAFTFSLPEIRQVAFLSENL